MIMSRRVVAVLFSVLSFAWLLGGCAIIPVLLRVDPEHLHFEETQLKQGMVATDFTLNEHDGRSRRTLSELRGKPVVLIFGSYT